MRYYRNRTEKTSLNSSFSVLEKILSSEISFYGRHRAPAVLSKEPSLVKARQRKNEGEGGACQKDRNCANYAN